MQLRGGNSSPRKIKACRSRCGCVRSLISDWTSMAMSKLRTVLLNAAAFIAFGTYPVAAGALLDSANNAYQSGQTGQAIELYRQAALAGENPALCYFNMANAYFQSDSLPQSIVYYKSSLIYAPDFFRGYLNLAIAYYTLEDMGATIAQIRRALELKPGHEKATLILAASYRKAGARPQAIAAFERLLEINSENEEAYLQLAEMYRELADDQAASDWLLQYPEKGQNKQYVYALLADIYEKKGDLSRTLFYLKESFELDKSNKWTFFRMVNVLIEMGNDLVALEEAGRGLELFPDFAELALVAANVAFEHEKWNEAERFYLVAQDNGSANAVIGLENIRIIRLKQDEGESGSQIYADEIEEG
ncbi:MAG: tetratricopeptide repeat protein [Chitinivibrionales bacterium]|nr:tetratricopeptide repeat protein [Chitinivibrionales bacterium]